MINGIVSLIFLPDLSLIVNRNSRDFCVLSLYPVTLLNSLINSSSFLGIIRIFYVHHVLCKQWQFYLFFSNFHSFYLFFFAVMARTSKTILNNSGKGEHPCALGLSYMAFVNNEVGFFYAFFGRVVYYYYYYCKKVLNFVKRFFCIYWDDNSFYCSIF